MIAYFQNTSKATLTSRSFRSQLECCKNYRVVGNSCLECWPGTFGDDCKDYCPSNFYGRLCLEQCGCQPCDKVTGCFNATHTDQNTSSNTSSSGEDESPTNSATWLTLSTLASCFVICFIFCLRIFCILRRMPNTIPTDLTEYDSPNRMVSLENRRRSGSLTSRTMDSSPTSYTETSYTQLDRSK